MPEIVVEELEVGFGSGAARNLALRGVDLAIASGTFTMVMGPSGSGKTSLLTALAGLVRPDRGRIVIGGSDLTRMSDRSRLEFRRRNIGFVFQSFRLMAALNAEENIRFSLAMRGLHSTRDRAREALERVGLGEKAGLLPDQMSGGEKQRVAIARALAHDPPMILADEPTASLDSTNGLRVAEHLAEAAAKPDRCLVVVSHDDRLAPFARRIVRLEDGRIVENGE